MNEQANRIYGYLSDHASQNQILPTVYYSL